MPYSIISSMHIRTIVKNGRNLHVKYATRTTAWVRILLAKSVQHQFVRAIENADVPERAASAILAETEHPSTNDSKEHFTTVYEDEGGKHISTKHVYR